MKRPEKLAAIPSYEPAPAGCPVRLDANESFLSPPDWLAEKIERALRAVPLNRYPDPAAGEVCRLFAELYGFPAGGVVAGNGSDELIGLILAAFVPRGGRVFISEPDFSMYRFYAGLYELHCVPSRKTGGRPDMEALRDAYRTAGADLIIFSNPCNPTGLGAAREEVLSLVDAVDCPVVVDEAYMDFWDQSILPECRKRENAVVLRTCSKALGLAGARLGFALTNDDAAGTLRAVKSPFNVNALSQAAGAAVLRETEYVRAGVEAVKTAVRTLYEGLAEVAATAGRISVHPTETNFVLVTAPDAGAVCEGLRARGVSVRVFPPDTLRITAGSEAEHEALFRALRDVLAG